MNPVSAAGYLIRPTLGLSPDKSQVCVTWTLCELNPS